MKVTMEYLYLEREEKPLVSLIQIHNDGQSIVICRDGPTDMAQGLFLWKKGLDFAEKELLEKESNESNRD